MPSIITMRDMPTSYHVKDEEISLEDLSGEWIVLTLMEKGTLTLRTSAIAAIRQVTDEEYAELKAEKNAILEKIKAGKTGNIFS